MREAKDVRGGMNHRTVSPHKKQMNSLFRVLLSLFNPFKGTKCSFQTISGEIDVIAWNQTVENDGVGLLGKGGH
jgi:hypothetical protein